MSTLVLVRHGQSQWNLENRFTGWTDVPLTEQGKKDAAASGKALSDFSFDVIWTSRLIRAKDTLDLMLPSFKNKDAPIFEDSALNERHYGDLQGLNKAETAERHGQEQVLLWRRSYDTRPPNGESLADCERRTIPVFMQYIWPFIQAGKNVLIVAHGNSLRPIMKHLEDIPKDKVAGLEIGLCTPYVYTFDGEKLKEKNVIEVPGIVTLGASQTQRTVEAGRV